MKIIYFVLALLLLISITEISYSQYCDSCGCGTVPFVGEDPNPGSFRGGFYKPSRTDIEDPNADLQYFPVIIVFIQFQDEPSYSSLDSNAWPSMQPPNYLNRLISENRITSVNWWDAYNGYNISDYWHEFSRGKLHVTGKAFSIILPQNKIWYTEHGGLSKINKDIYDSLKLKINEDQWLKYDNWKMNSVGNFSQGRDGLVDMIYMVYRQRDDLFLQGGYYGEATLGNCEGAVDNNYTVYQIGSTPVVSIRSVIDLDTLGSGLRVSAFGTSKFSRQTFLDLVTHEHGHYLFGSGHKSYTKMNNINSEFSIGPWESIKLGYIKQKIVDYSDETFFLFDYSSHGGTAGTDGEVIQIPVNSDSTEFFLLANRRKESQWDSRVGGDSLSEDKYQHFKNTTNPEYGKGFYIYHVKNGYSYGEYTNSSIDLECADGLWNWKYAGFSRPDIKNPNNLIPVMIKTTPGYDNDNPSVSDTASKDEMSERKLINGIHVTSSFSPGSHDISYSQRGTSSLYTNENDYWYSLANLGDRWDAWNTGYNEIFSPYSSPNTNDMNIQPTGIFVWYDSLETGTNKARIKIYRESGIG